MTGEGVFVGSCRLYARTWKPQCLSREERKSAVTNEWSPMAKETREGALKVPREFDYCKKFTVLMA
jgi:hypothetical protein